MNQNLSRRDFLKIAGVGLGALITPWRHNDLFNPNRLPFLEYLSLPKRLPDFPQSEIIGRTTDVGVDLRNHPTNDPAMNSSIAKLEADTLVEWGRQVIGNVVDDEPALRGNPSGLHLFFCPSAHTQSSEFPDFRDACRATGVLGGSDRTTCRVDP
jgi:hypothetical protein